jgi:hypothetical protein
MSGTVGKFISRNFKSESTKAIPNKNTNTSKSDVDLGHCAVITSNEECFFRGTTFKSSGTPQTSKKGSVALAKWLAVGG